MHSPPIIRWLRGLDLSLERMITYAAGLAVLILVLLGMVTFISTMRLVDDAASVKDAQESLTRLSSLLSATTDVETGARGFVITGDERFLESYHQGRAKVESILDALRGDTQHAVVRQQLDSLASELRERLANLTGVVELRRAQGFAAARDRIKTGMGRLLHDRVRRRVSTLMRLEGTVIAQRERRTTATAHFTRLSLLLAIGLGVIVLMGGQWLIKQELRLRRSVERSLKETTALHQAVLDGAEHAIIAGDEKGVTLFNRGAERLLGYQADEVVGKVTAALFHDPAEVMRRARDLTTELDVPVEAGMETFLIKSRLGLRDVAEWTYIRKDGGRVPVLLSVTVLRDEQGRIQSFLGIAQDYSVQKEAERALWQSHEELTRAKERAEAADRVKSVFLATMSHELRTPLNSIIGFTGILLQELAGPVNEEQRRQLEMVRGSGRHLLALINDVLDISKIEAEELQVQAAPFALGAAIDKVITSVTHQAEGKGLALKWSVDPGIGELMQDQRRVEQVLLNLLSNAIKFTPAGEVDLVARLRGDWIDMEVRDTGMGIRPEDMAVLFQPFRQLESGLDRNFEGTGLGLAISLRLARLMGGEVRAVSEPGRGSTFTLTLPKVMERPA